MHLNIRHATICDMIDTQIPLAYQKEALEDIIKSYADVSMTVTDIAKKYNVTVRTIQRLVKKHGVIRTVSEANKVTAKLKDYSGHRVAVHLRKKRKSLSPKLRYQMIKDQPYCSICHNDSKDFRLEIDHIDENPFNNERSNLQVLCKLCNSGKSHSIRYPQD